MANIFESPPNSQEDNKETSSTLLQNFQASNQNTQKLVQTNQQRPPLNLRNNLLRCNNSEQIEQQAQQKPSSFLNESSFKNMPYPNPRGHFNERNQTNNGFQSSNITKENFKQQGQHQFNYPHQIERQQGESYDRSNNFNYNKKSKNKGFHQQTFNNNRSNEYNPNHQNYQMNKSPHNQQKFANDFGMNKTQKGDNFYPMRQQGNFQQFNQDENHQRMKNQFQEARKPQEMHSYQNQRRQYNNGDNLREVQGLNSEGIKRIMNDAISQQFDFFREEMIGLFQNLSIRESSKGQRNLPPPEISEINNQERQRNRSPKAHSLIQKDEQRQLQTPVKQNSQNKKEPIH